MDRQTNLGGLSKHSMHVWCKALWTIDHLANLSMLHGWDAMEYLVHEVLWRRQNQVQTRES